MKPSLWKGTFTLKEEMSGLSGLLAEQCWQLSFGVFVLWIFGVVKSMTMLKEQIFHPEKSSHTFKKVLVSVLNSRGK